MIKTLRLNWLAFASSLLLLGAVLVIFRKEQDFGAVFDAWRRIEPGPFALAVALMVFVQATSAWRIGTIMSADGLHTGGLLPLLRIVFISQFVAHGAPISAFADVARAVMIKLRFSMPTGQSIRIVLYERIAGAIGTLVVGLVTAIFEFRMSVSQTLINLQLLLWGVGLVGVVILLTIGRLHVRTGIDLINRLAQALMDFGKMLRRPLVVARLLLASLGQLLAFAAIFLVLAYGMHLSLNAWSAVVFMPLIYFISSLPFFYQGWGAREAVVIATIGNIGTVTSAEAAAVSVAFGVVVFLASLPGAVFWMMRPSMRKAMRIDQNA